MPREYADGMLDVVVSLSVASALRTVEGIEVAAQDRRTFARTAPEPAAQIARDQARALDYIAGQIKEAHRRRMELFRHRPDLAPKRQPQEA